MHRCLPALCLASSALLVSATPRLWSIEEVAASPSAVAGVSVPHRKFLIRTHLYWWLITGVRTDKRQVIEGPGGYRFNVLEHLAGIAPYFDSPGVQLDPSPPDGCTVTKATYIVRHSNIFANDVCDTLRACLIRTSHRLSLSLTTRHTYLPFSPSWPTTRTGLCSRAHPT